MGGGAGSRCDQGLVQGVDVGLEAGPPAVGLDVGLHGLAVQARGSQGLGDMAQEGVVVSGHADEAGAGVDVVDLGGDHGHEPGEVHVELEGVHALREVEIEVGDDAHVGPRQPAADLGIGHDAQEADVGVALEPEHLRVGMGGADEDDIAVRKAQGQLVQQRNVDLFFEVADEDDGLTRRDRG